MSRAERGIYTRFLKDGTQVWDAMWRVQDPETGRSKLVKEGGFRREALAIAARRKALRNIDDGTYVAPTKLTVRAFLEKWLIAIAPTVKPSTAALYRTNVSAYILGDGEGRQTGRPHLGDVQLRLLAPEHLNALYAALSDHGRRDGKGLSPRSVRIVHVVLHRALRDAVKWGDVQRNVAALADPPREDPTEKDCYGPDEVAKLLAHLKNDRLFALWRLAATSGMRRGETLALRWRDVDLDGASLTVTQTVVVVNHKPSISPTTKTKAGRRRVSLDPETVAVLKRHKTRQGEERLAGRLPYYDGDLCFTREEGSVLHPEAITKTFDRHRKAAGLPPATFHSLRHSHATALLQSGVSVRTVAQRLGHASPTVTMQVYSHLLPGDDEAAAEIGARLLGGAG